MDNHNKFFDVAKAISHLSDFKRIHIGCVIADRRGIISTGFNTNKTHPLQKEYNIYRFRDDTSGNGKLHAEMKAILSLPKDIDTKKLVIYTYREDKFGNTRMSRPCPACMQKIKELGIKTICYTTEDGRCVEDISNHDEWIS